MKDVLKDYTPGIKGVSGKTNIADSMRLALLAVREKLIALLASLGWYKINFYHIVVMAYKGTLQNLIPSATRNKIGSKIQKMTQNIDNKNSIFWNDICGSNMAIQLGINDDSAESLKKYDDFYLNYYPYLLLHVPVDKFKGLKVLEVGLGYGTLSQQIAENCSYYRGLDIAAGPVNLVNKRLSSLPVDGKAIVGSIKECPF